MIDSFKDLDQQRLGEIAWDVIGISELYGVSYRAPESVSNKRMEICRACPEYDEKENMCLNCGCPLEVKSVHLTDKCPIDKWGPESEEWKKLFFEAVEEVIQTKKFQMEEEELNNQKTEE